MYMINRTSADRKCKLRRAILIFVLFTLGTIRIGGNSHFFEMMFVENSDYPGGPAVWFFEHYNAPGNAVSTVTFVIGDIITSTIVVSSTYT